jgi:hypothetical protein
MGYKTPVMFRIYGPQKPIADKSWALNDLERVPGCRRRTASLR